MAFELAQSTAAQQPAYIAASTTFNGEKSMDFQNDWLYSKNGDHCSALDNGAPWTIYVVCQSDYAMESTDNGRYPYLCEFQSEGASTNNLIRLRIYHTTLGTNGYYRFDPGVRTSSGGFATFFSTAREYPNTERKHVVCFRCDSTALYLDFYTHGDATQYSASDSTALQGVEPSSYTDMRLGCSRFSNSYEWRGEIPFYGQSTKFHSDAEVAATLKVLKGRYF